MNTFRRRAPWWLKIAAKIILSRLPIPYSFWKRMRLFEHGDMNRPERAWATFLEHSRTAGILNENSALPCLKVANNFIVLEMGCGDSVFTAVIAKTLNASRTYLVDAGEFATTNISAYRTLFDFLHQQGFDLFFTHNPETVIEILQECNAEYLTQGVQSLAHLPSASIDYCFSNAVLEHIPKCDFSNMVAEFFRILKSDGVCVHRVDLKDHLGGGLNNLRFSESVWEGRLFSRSGFYTNRIRFKEMLNMFTQAGFAYTLPRIVHWDNLPIARDCLDTAFSQLSDEDLLVSGFDIVLKKPAKVIV